MSSLEFKAHPYYDQSDAREWMYLRWDDWDELEPGPEKTLQDMLRADKAWLCELALDQIRRAAGENYLAERPDAELGDFLFFPHGENGYQAYVEWRFFPRPYNNSITDWWWAIINSPTPIAQLQGGRRQAHIVGLGWIVG